MKSDFFIDRPIFSIVISIVIVIVGVLGLFLLPIDQYPQIVPPVVKVSASYPGASAQTVTQAVATPIEQELNGTPGMLYMESTNSNSGSFSATITFDISTDPDLAAVEIQNRVKQAEARLPAEVVQNGISVEKQASSRLMTVTLRSNDPKFDEIYLSNYATLNVLDMLRRVKGVGSVSNVGSRYYAMQIWVQPDRLANLGLTVDDLQKALKDQNRESAAGVLGQQPISDIDITTPMVLCAVFVPVSFLAGITGQLYRQFTITIAVSVLISTLVALTLSPAMCALLLKPDSGKKKNKLFRYINLWLARGNRLYEKLIRKGLKHARRVVAAFGISLIAIWVLNEIVPQSFMPQEDQGYFTVELELPEGATLERTRHVTERAMNYLMSREDVEYILNVTGSSPRVGTNQSRSQLTVILKPWEDRKSSNLRDIMEEIREELKKYPESKVYLSTPPVIPGLGSSGGFEMVLEARSDASYADLQRAADTLLYYASQRKEISGLSSSIQNDIPQLYFDVDRDKAQMLGVKIADIFSTLKTFTGSIYVNDFNMFNRIYRVYIQAEAPYRAHKDNLGLFFVKGSNNAMIPITALGTTSYTTGPGTIRRFNMFTSTTISGEAAPGYSSGQAMAILEEIASKHLPKNIGVEWSGLSYQEKHVSGQTAYILALALLFVFLFLAAQYESWSIPIAVILSLPIAGVGAYLGNWICGLENNIYFQIGLVMLVGLVAKNAILIVEFAKDEVEKGNNAVDAVIKAAHLRFRPIVMTSLAFILGMLPLVFASGPGSASRQGIGTGVFFGMIVAITVGIIFVPLLFVWVYKLKSKMMKR